ncbi:hypothetical protein LshimejAT787_1400450 [Lyophyllum shimeji]|uniref:Uncharacterized protein n=1 Tax=Lyophyllum shimeji TaxID=47721 RepID=A0A9P3PXS7_LYOSH|nr:hypothetical protein LshimejAT787_1400450 [Lyophyllum shimeji]
MTCITLPDQSAASNSKFEDRSIVDVGRHYWPLPLPLLFMRPPTREPRDGYKKRDFVCGAQQNKSLEVRSIRNVITSDTGLERAAPARQARANGSCLICPSCLER